MATRLVHLGVDAADPAALARFWADSLGWEIAAQEPDEVVVEPAGYRYPDPSALALVFVPVADKKNGKNRVHLDLASQSADDMAARVALMRDLGATDVDIGQGDVPWVVLADPEGNEFCVLEPRPEYAGMLVAAVVIDSPDPGSAARFWEQAIGWPVQHSDDEWTAQRAPAGTGPFLEFLADSAAKSAKNRMHLDVAPAAGDDRAAEVARLRQLGAVPADVGQGDVPWVVLADPQGNEFCVLSSR
jgi:predicted enzyme related to lactoylglutathione lyase